MSLRPLPVPTLSRKSSSNTDTGPGKLSSAEPLVSVFSEDLVKVMMIFNNAASLRVVLKGYHLILILKLVTKGGSVFY